MSEQEHLDSKSSVTLARNAKGECQPQVKVYEGTTKEELARISDLAVDQFRNLEREFYGAAAK